eukprot:gene12185-biopygen4750
MNETGTLPARIANTKPQGLALGRVLQYLPQSVMFPGDPGGTAAQSSYVSEGVWSDDLEDRNSEGSAVALGRRSGSASSVSDGTPPPPPPPPGQDHGNRPPKKFPFL